MLQSNIKGKEFNFLTFLDVSYVFKNVLTLILFKRVLI